MRKTVAQARARRVVPALAAVLLGGLLAGSAAGEPVGFLALVEGDVEVQPGGTASFAAASLDQDVEIGDTIRTGRDSLAKLVLVDDTTLTLDEETELEIDRYVVGSAATREPSRVDLLGGQVRTVVGEAFGGATRLEVHTPTAVIGVKGTEWITWYLAHLQTTWVCVISGIVSVESADPAVVGSYEPPLGSCARVMPHARPEPAELPRDLSALGSVRAAVPPPEPSVPAVAAGPGGELPTVPTDVGTEEAISDSLDAALTVTPQSITDGMDSMGDMMEPMEEPEPGPSGFPTDEGPGDDPPGGFPGDGGPGDQSGGG